MFRIRSQGPLKSRGGGRTAGWRRFRMGVVAVLTVWCLGTSGRAGDTDTDPLGRLIDLDLTGQDLGEAVRQLTQRSGVDFLVGLDVARPEEFERLELHLVLRGCSVRMAADWVARALGTRYRVTEAGQTITFTSSYLWLDRVVPVMRDYNVGGVVEWPRREAFAEVLSELLRIHAIRADYSLQLRETDRRLQAVLAPELQGRLGSILRALAAPGRVPRHRPLPWAEGQLEVEASLQREVNLAYRERSVAAIVGDLAFQADVNIGFDHVPFSSRSFPVLTLDGGVMTLRAALGKLCESTVFAGWQVDVEGGVWLRVEAGDCPVTVSRELLWEDVPVLAYALKPLPAGRKGGEVIAAWREALPADVRGDPSVGIAYDSRSGNAVVVAPMVVQRWLESVLLHSLGYE